MHVSRPTSVVWHDMDAAAVVPAGETVTADGRRVRSAEAHKLMSPAGSGQRHARARRVLLLLATSTWSLQLLATADWATNQAVARSAIRLAMVVHTVRVR